MAKDLGGYAWKDLCEQILGHEIPHGTEISATTLLAASQPKDKGKSVLHNVAAGDTMRESLLGVVDSRQLHRNRRGAS